MTTKTEKTGVWALIGKLGGKFFAFVPKLLKATKLVKFGLFAASFASYAVLFSWKFAILIMLSVGWHEYGHIFGMKKVGIPTKGFYFLPFLGGVALASSSPKTFADWCKVALAGPVFGFALALLTAGLYFTTHIPLFGVAASWMALLNLFNLFPVSPLDGHHVLKAVAISLHKRLGLIAIAIVYAVCIVVLMKLHIGLFVFFGTIGLVELIIEFWVRRHNKKKVEEDLADYIERHKNRDWITTPETYELIENPTPEQRAENYEQKRQWFNKLYGLNTKYPDDLTKPQMLLTLLSYVALVVSLLVLMNMTAHIPGADIASEFMRN